MLPGCSQPARHMTKLLKRYWYAIVVFFSILGPGMIRQRGQRFRWHLHLFASRRQIWVPAALEYSAVGAHAPLRGYAPNSL